METIKTKSASKVVIPKSPALEKKILETMSTISQVVGATLGPGGHPVLIERSEYNLPPMVTKDGVTVFRSLGFQDPISHSILEAARDASVRTAVEAGDGTTTATILSEAFVRYTTEFCNVNPTVPPIKVVKAIQNIYQNNILPRIQKLTVQCDFSTKQGKERLWNVAKISGNGDTDLANAIMQCYELTGDDGNVTIIESTGESKYEAEKIDGYPVYSGYEEGCAKYFPVFINDPATQRVVMDKPIFLLYYGRVNDFQTIFPILEKLQDAHVGNYLDAHNVVLIATGFSESVLANLSSIWINKSNINVFPLVTTKTAVNNSERYFLDDVAAITGSVVFDPLTNPIEQAVIEDLGNLGKETQDVGGKDYDCYKPLGVRQFECGRYRSTIIGYCDEEILLKRVDEVKSAIPNAESEYDLRDLQNRLARLSGGIARLKVLGSSNGELKERRDRAEDAVCAVRGAIKHGALIGGGWTLLNIVNGFSELEDGLEKQVAKEIVESSFISVVNVLFQNAGLDLTNQPKKVIDSIKKGNPEKAIVVDISSGKPVEALKEGILDSVPSLKEAIKNAISIATLLGTLGGCVVYPRDHTAEIAEARDANEFNRLSNMNTERP